MLSAKFIFHPPQSPFICLPSVIWSVTSPVIHRCDCKLWLFVLKHVNLVKVCQRPTPREKNKIKHLNVMESWGWSPFGCYLTSCRPPPSRQMSCIHPFVHPSIHQLIISNATGLEIITIWITWRGDGYKEDRRPVTQVLWVETLTMLRRSASCPPPLPGSHTDPNVRCRQKHGQAGTDVAAWARSVENALLDVLPHRGLDCLFTTCWVVTLRTGLLNLMISSRRATLPPRV